MKARALLISACLVVAGLSVGPAPTATAADGGSPRVMVIGDSITQGSAGDWTWRYRLYKHLMANGVSPDMVGPKNDLYDNVAGQHGAQTYADPNFDRDHNGVWGRPALQAKDTVEAEVRSANPDYALILLGINDLAWFTDPATTGQSLRTLITNARRAKPGLKIVLGRVLPTDRAADEPAFAAKVAELNATINTIATSMTTVASPITIAATDAGFNAATDTWDGVHPNARGEYKVAAAFADALKAKFGLGAAFPRPLPAVATGPRIAPTLSVVNRDGAADLSWTRSPGADGYWVWTRNVTEGEAWGKLPIPLPGASWTAGLLRNGGTYEFKLQTAKGRDTGVYSNVVTAKPSGPSPAGTSLSVSNGDREVRLSWTKVPNATDFFVWTRNVTEGQAWSKLPIPLGGTSWTAGLLSNGGEYEFKLQSRNGYQIGAYSNVVTGRPTGPTPGSPTLSVTPANRGANLSWTAVPNATAYYVLVKNVALLETEFTRLPYPISGTQWKATEMSAGAAYRFKVQAINGYIKGGMSNEATVTPTGVVPAAPRVSVSYSGSTASLSWPAVDQATHYDVYERNLTVGQTGFNRVEMWVPLQGTTYQPWLEWGETPGVLPGAQERTPGRPEVQHRAHPAHEHRVRRHRAVDDRPDQHQLHQLDGGRDPLAHERRRLRAVPELSAVLRQLPRRPSRLRARAVGGPGEARRVLGPQADDQQLLERPGPLLGRRQRDEPEGLLRRVVQHPLRLRRQGRRDLGVRADPGVALPDLRGDRRR